MLSWGGSCTFTQCTSSAAFGNTAIYLYGGGEHAGLRRAAPASRFTFQCHDCDTQCRHLMQGWRDCGMHCRRLTEPAQQRAPARAAAGRAAGPSRRASTATTTSQSMVRFACRVHHVACMLSSPCGLHAVFTMSLACCVHHVACMLCTLFASDHTSMPWVISW